MTETNNNLIVEGKKRLPENLLLDDKHNIHVHFIRFLFLFVIAILIYFLTVILPVRILVWQISSCQSHSKCWLIWNQRTMTAAIPVLIRQHWELVLAERFQNCEDIYIMNTYNKRICVWNGLIKIYESLPDNKITNSIELYFIVHARSSDIRTDEYYNLCSLFKQKNLKYKWLHPQKFADEKSILRIDEVILNREQ
jgi:hypothetical protein